MADCAQTIATAYAVDGAALDLGRGVHDGAVVTEAVVKLPLRMVVTCPEHAIAVT